MRASVPLFPYLPVPIVAVLLLLTATLPLPASALDARQIIQRSVEANEADWKAAPDLAYVEREVINKGGARTVKTYKVMMIDGSPYNQLLAVDDQPLSPAHQARERARLAQEIARRKHETREERSSRISKYEKSRHQDHALMQQMTKALDFRLRGKDTLNGYPVYVFDATPHAGYQPPNHETRVLTGMKGTLWVNRTNYQWVKVEAEVFRPVSFGLFIAKVSPGTRFVLEQAPLSGPIWEPKHFKMEVHASILWWTHNSSEDDTFRDYQPNRAAVQQPDTR